MPFLTLRLKLLSSRSSLYEKKKKKTDKIGIQQQIFIAYEEVICKIQAVNSLFVSDSG